MRQMLNKPWAASQVPATQSQRNSGFRENKVSMHVNSSISRRLRRGCPPGPCGRQMEDEAPVSRCQVFSAFYQGPFCPDQFAPSLNPQDFSVPLIKCRRFRPRRVPQLLPLPCPSSPSPSLHTRAQLPGCFLCCIVPAACSQWDGRIKCFLCKSAPILLVHTCLYCEPPFCNQLW